MNKTIKIYIGLLVLLFGAITFIELSRQRPINWTPTYNEKHKIPFGTYILHEELKNVFQNQDFQDIKQTPYEFFDSKYDWEEKTYNVTGNFESKNS